MAELSVVVAFSAGLLSFLSPCVLPLLPSYLSLLTGMSVDRLRGAPESRVRVAAHAVAFIAGFSMVFVAMGASLSALGQFLLEYRDLIRRVGGALIVLFGLSVAGVLPLGWLGRSWQLPLRSRPAGLLGSWLVGVTFAVGWVPCVGPILGAILSLAAGSETVGAGVVMLGAYSAGLALPFFLASLALGAVLAATRQLRPYLPAVERAAGVLLVLVGLLVFTNQFTVLNAYALRLTPEWLLRRL